MLRRTTVDIDDELLTRAKRALGLTTTRKTVEQALRQAAESAEDASAERADRQRRYLRQLSGRLDTDVLRSEGMWR